MATPLALSSAERAPVALTFVTRTCLLLGGLWAVGLAACALPLGPHMPRPAALGAMPEGGQAGLPAAPR